MSKYWVWGLILGLVLLHQDGWFWTDDRLVFGFLPVGLFYHICLSIGAVVCWFLAVKYAWPQDLVEQTVDESNVE